MKELKQFRWLNRGIPLYVFALFFLIGLFAYKDYGVSADEAAVRQFGIDSFNYLFQGGHIPTQLDWSFFNPLVTVVMRGLELGLGLTDGADIWFMRHLVTFCMFFLTIVAFYRIARYRFPDWKLPLLGSLMFMLSPRIFAHGFYNPKDIPALLFFTVSAWSLLAFLRKKSIPSFLALIVSAAMLIGIRAFGILIPVLTLLFLWLEKGMPTKKKLQWSLALPLTLAVVLILSWPLLWQSPVHHLIGAFLNSGSRSGGGFYFGEMISTSATPWHYLPVWIFITTPVVYSFFFWIGLIVFVYGIVKWANGEMGKWPFAHPTIRPFLLAVLWFFLPLIALMILRAGIFDEWRHMLFLYPAFLLIALEGIDRMRSSRHRLLRIGTMGLLGLQLASTGFWMLRNHPFEYAYFSIPTRFIQGNFELDYWGLSYREGLQWIADNDARTHINVFTAARVGKTAADTLPIEDWDRLYFTTPDKADYILDNFRAHNYRQVFPEDRKVHSITVDGLEILAVYRGPDTQKIFEPVIW